MPSVHCVDKSFVCVLNEDLFFHTWMSYFSKLGVLDLLITMWYIHLKVLFLFPKSLKCVQSVSLLKNQFPLPPWEQSRGKTLPLRPKSTISSYMWQVFVPLCGSSSSSRLLEQSIASPLSLSLLGTIGDQLSPNSSSPSSSSSSASFFPSTSPSSSPPLCLQ